MAKKIGIDLGTTYSCISYVNDLGEIKIIDNSEGEQTTPSVVFFDPNGEAVVGSTAKQEGGLNPECLVERVKNYMGDPNYSCFKNGVDYSAAAVSSLILKKLIGDAESALGEDIDGVVITCPAYFGEEARNATKVAGESVTLSNGQPVNVLKILDEPTAAAIAYGNTKNEDMDKTILIYDLGGGTFDCTVMKLAFHGDNRQMQVITTGGNHQLGGKDWDAALTEYVRNKFCSMTGTDAEAMKQDPESVAWFSENIEKTKKLLTKKDNTTLTVSFDGAKERVEVTREDFDRETFALLNETIFLVNDMLEKKNLTIADIDEIILVGGSTRMPQVESILKSEYGKEIASFEPDKAVAMGAALVANDYSFDSAAAPVADVDGGAPVQKSEPMSLVNPKTGMTTVVIENCTKSYGVRIFTPDGEKVLNLIKKDTPKPAHGTSADYFDLTLTGDPSLVGEVDILVLENDNFTDDLVNRDECQEIYIEEPIQFGDQLPGNNKVAVEMFLDGNGTLSLVLTDLASGRSFTMYPKRTSDEANNVGMDAVKGMTLR